MKCPAVEPWLVDLGRGVALDADRIAEVHDHVRVCPGCAARLDSERAMSAALHRLAHAVDTPAPAPSSESALLAAFDAARSGRAPTRSWIIYPAAAAAVVLVAATLAWKHGDRVAPMATAPASAPNAIAPASPVTSVTTVAPAEATKALPLRTASPRRRIDAARATPAFISWPGATELPAFESGQLVRLDLPAALARSLGLVRSPQTAVVHADVLIGQDGFARAVRLAP